MALAQISDLWTPEIWLQALREKQATFPSILNSGVVVRSPVLDEVASGGGLIANLPFFKDCTDQADEIQVENTAPTILGLSSDVQVAPILNRVTANSVTALAAAVSGSDPVSAIIDSLVSRRMKQRNAVLLSIFRGAFGSAGANGASAALSNVRIDAFDESGNDATSDQTFGPDLFIAGKALMGELADELQGGALLIHPNVLAGLELADALSFQSGIKSDLPFTIRTYRGVPIFTSELLSRYGTTNGYVYDSYLVSKGAVAFGEKKQAAGNRGLPVVDAASLNTSPDAEKNNERIFDRTRFVMHLNGMKYNGNPSGQSATNAELATPGDWTYLYQTQNRAGIVCIRTNK